jgi:hypothetical protein
MNIYSVIKCGKIPKKRAARAEAELFDVGVRFPLKNAEYRKQTAMLGPVVLWACPSVFLTGCASGLPIKKAARRLRRVTNAHAYDP